MPYLYIYDYCKSLLLYQARDAFFMCIQQAGDDDAAGCKALRAVYDSTCPIAWVKHFDKKRIYQEHKVRTSWLEVKSS